VVPSPTHLPPPCCFILLINSFFLFNFDFRIFLSFSNFNFEDCLYLCYTMPNFIFSDIPTPNTLRLFFVILPRPSQISSTDDFTSYIPLLSVISCSHFLLEPQSCLILLLLLLLTYCPSRKSYHFLVYLYLIFMFSLCS